MATVFTVNTAITFVCDRHPTHELKVYRHASGASHVIPCIRCQQEKDMTDSDHIALIQSLQERLEKSEKSKKLPKIYINSKKINFKKGGKK